MPVSRSLRTLRIFETALAALVLAVLGFGAVVASWRHGWLLYYGDAQAHLNIARRILDSRTPGYEQIGTVWLPLPHLLALGWATDDAWWRSGLAGSLPSAVCFVIAGTLLFAAARRIFSSSAAAFAAALLFALNPNLLYLQSTAMTETIFFAALCALLYATVRFSESQSWWTVALAGAAAVAAALTRYEGWFLIPFATLFFLIAARRHRLAVAAIFGALAASAPLYWLAHNWWLYGDPLEFYRGPYSAKVIYETALAGGMQPYAGDHDWAKAWLYFRSAVALTAGRPLLWIGAAGLAVCLLRRWWWPALLLALPPVFYLWSIHSGGTPIFVPQLWPFTYYNTRYGLAALPLLALAGGALAATTPARFRAVAAVAVVAAAVVPWLVAPRPQEWICWRESQVNSEARRAWTGQAAEYLRTHYRGGGILTSFGDLTGIFREAGIPLRETLHQGNVPYWEGAVARPDLLLHEEWAVAISGDKVSGAMLKAARRGPSYNCVKIIAVKGAPVIEIYKRN